MRRDVLLMSFNFCSCSMRLVLWKRRRVKFTAWSNAQNSHLSSTRPLPLAQRSPTWQGWLYAENTRFFSVNLRIHVCRGFTQFLQANYQTTPWNRSQVLCTGARNIRRTCVAFKYASNKSAIDVTQRNDLQTAQARILCVVINRWLSVSEVSTALFSEAKNY